MSENASKVMEDIKAREGKRLVASVEEFARMFGISRQLAYSLARSKAIPALRLGQRRLVIPLAAIEKMLAEGWEPEELR